MSHGFEITCRCGHRADIDAFTGTPIFGDLPNGHFQCPACHRAWTRAPAGEWRTITAPNGATIAIPERIELVPIQARL